MAVPDEDKQKALAAWWNSTPVRVMLLNRRAQKFTYPAWSSLREAFDEVFDVELLPMKHAEECGARKVIDDAAALVLGAKPEVLADWRRQLAAEPTITNRQARDA